MRKDTKTMLKDAIDYLEYLKPDYDTGPLIQSGRALISDPNPDYDAFYDWIEAFIHVLKARNS